MAFKPPLRIFVPVVILFLMCFATSHVFHKHDFDSLRRTWPFTICRAVHGNNHQHQHKQEIRRHESVQQRTRADLLTENRLLWDRYRSKSALRETALEILQKGTTTKVASRIHRHKRQSDVSLPSVSLSPAATLGSGSESSNSDSSLLSQNDHLRDVLGDLETLIASLAKLIVDELPSSSSCSSDSTSFSQATSAVAPLLPDVTSALAQPSPVLSAVQHASSQIPIGTTVTAQRPSDSLAAAPYVSTLLSSMKFSSLSYYNTSSLLSPTNAVSPHGLSPSLPSTSSNNANTPNDSDGNSNANDTGTTFSGSSSSSASGSFNPMSSSNLAVYYGQTPATSSVSLSTLCQNPNIDIVILAFVTSLSSSSSSSSSSANSKTNAQYFPTLNFGPYCPSGPSAAQRAAGATGLLDCTGDLAPQIQSCQANGKKVLLSLGGATGASGMVIESEEAAEGIADALWGLFGGGGDDADLEGLRPFGKEVRVDGFDDDNETHNPTHWPTLLARLRSHFANATSSSPSSSSSNAGAHPKPKPYFLSSAPQCPRPDASIPPPPTLNTLFDFVFVQFYNNPACQLSNPSGFADSVRAWSSDLRHRNNNPSAGGFLDVGNGVEGGPRLFIGAPSWPEGAGSGYVDARTLVGLVGEVSGGSEGVGNLGGVMLWDGAEGVANGNGFVETVKAGMGA